MEKPILSVLAQVPVKFPQCWRGIEITSTASIADLACAILVAFEVQGDLPWTVVGADHFYAFGSTGLEESIFGVPESSPLTPLSTLKPGFELVLGTGLFPIFEIQVKGLGVRLPWPTDRQAHFPRLVAGKGPRIPDGISDAGFERLARAQKRSDPRLEATVREDLKLGEDELKDWRYNQSVDLAKVNEGFRERTRALVKMYQTKYK